MIKKLKHRSKKKYNKKYFIYMRCMVYCQERRGDYGLVYQVDNITYDNNQTIVVPAVRYFYSKKSRRNGENHHAVYCSLSLFRTIHEGIIHERLTIEQFLDIHKVLSIKIHED